MSPASAKLEAAMPATVHVFDYLAAPHEYPPQPVCVLFGEERYLKQAALRELRSSLTGADGEESPYASFEGPTAEWRDVADEVSTASLFGGGRRIVLVQEADEFVRRHRLRLEQYLAAPKSTGVLVLHVVAWPSNARLYDAVAEGGLAIDCRPPEKLVRRTKVLDEARICSWLGHWASSRHDIKLRPQAAQLMLELVGPEFGLLDQELAKLALFTERGGQVTPEMVRDIVGGWRTRTIWELLDSAAAGDAGEALRQLDRLLYSGANPVALFGQISWSLRRFAAATRIYQQAERDGRRLTLRNALQEAGFRQWPKNALEIAERQLKQLGRHRAGRFYQWLLEADLALKGDHSSPDRARFVLERLFVRLARPLGTGRRGERAGMA